MNGKRYPEEFKIEAVKQVVIQPIPGWIYGPEVKIKGPD
ncbi:hypothetical protein ECC18A13_p11470 (plasmid) [Enterobacter sp. 18A13]|nr:hypothetical protein ECC18A13_p11470 [Enterobacter sp. 18A13]